MPTIGHFYITPSHGSFSPSYSTKLNELNDDNFNAVLGRITEQCPYKKGKSDTEDGLYYNWKQKHLPLVFFTLLPSRPHNDRIIQPSGYACIDIDNCDTKFDTDHPAVTCINYTGNGTHIFIHSLGLVCSTPQQWQDEYNRIAYQIWEELNEKYDTKVKFDGRCADIGQGCFLWNTNWFGKAGKDGSYDPTYHSPDLYVSSTTIEQMYTRYTPAKQVATKSVIKVDGKIRQKERVFWGDSDILNGLADHSHIAQEIKEDFLQMSYTDFLDKYSEKYNKITGTVDEFEWYEDYNGNRYEMSKTNGQKVVLYEIWMKNPYSVPKGADGKPDYRTQKGHRRESIFKRALQTAQYTNEHLNPDHILFDAVLWCVTTCVDGLKFPKKELLEQVCNAIARRNTYECRLYTDRRMFISGSDMLDKATGEVVSMGKGDKIAANARCRKTERIISVVKAWKADKSIDENIESIRAWCDGMQKTTKRTIVSYLVAAQKMPSLVNAHPWLKDFEVQPQSRGRCKQCISILNKVTGEIIEFAAKQECMEYLGIANYQSFSNFLKGKTKLNKTYEVI